MVYSKIKYDALRSFYDQIERGESYVSAAEQAIGRSTSKPGADRVHCYHHRPDTASQGCPLLILD